MLLLINEIITRLQAITKHCLLFIGIILAITTLCILTSIKGSINFLEAATSVDESFPNPPSIPLTVAGTPFVCVCVCVCVCVNACQGINHVHVCLQVHMYMYYYWIQ